MRELDPSEIEEVTRPAIEALRVLPDTDELRRGTTEMVVLEKA